ncbi:MAG: hypothetical protein KKD83_08700 [Chloroflexi bacterium]|nr:hypothetical protein [Chloroflexota bacterium]
MMKGLPFRVWSLVTITPVFAAIIIRIIWELAVNFSTSGLLMSALVIIGVLGLYALLFYLILKPNLKLLTSLPVWIGIAVLMTGGMIGASIHLTRFLPSHQSELPWSLVLALLYAFAMFNAYCILLWFVWSLWKKKHRKE